jgi:inner membrane protein
MQGKTHMVIGSAASILLLPKLGYDPDIVTTAVAAVSALICDIDHPKAMINQRILPVKNKMAKIIVYAGAGAFLLYKNMTIGNPILTMIGALLIAIGLSHHRGFTHSIIGVSAISFVLLNLLKNLNVDNFLIAAVVGLVSHPISDCFTKDGIEILYPFSKKNYRFPITITTGGTAEKFVNVAVIIFMVNWFVTYK